MSSFGFMDVVILAELYKFKVRLGELDDKNIRVKTIYQLKTKIKLQYR